MKPIQINLTLGVIAIGMCWMALLRPGDAVRSSEEHRRGYEDQASAASVGPAMAKSPLPEDSGRSALADGNMRGQFGSTNHPGQKGMAWRNTLKRALAETGNASLLRLVQTTRIESSKEERAVLLDELARSLIAADPARAALLLEQTQDARDQTDLATRMIRLLLESDSKAAVAWAADLSPEKIADQVHEILGREWARSDVDAVIGWLQTLPSERLQAAGAEGLIWTWAQRDLQEVVSWANQLAESNLRQRAFLKTAKILAARDPSAAAAWALQFPENYDRKGALTYAVHQWSQRDVGAAARWAESVEDIALRDSALAAVAMAWANRDPAQAAHWTAQLPEGARAEAWPIVREKWLAREPEAALAWAAGH